MIKKYEIKVDLKGFEKLITRRYAINDNVKISDLCRVIIKTMHGDLSHLYLLKHKDITYVCDYMDASDYGEKIMGSLKISKLGLEKNDKLILVYDFGDNWTFRITVKKVLDGHNEKDFILLSGIGKGIEDDCGGTWGLKDLIENPKNNWGYDINDFKIDDLNAYLDEYFN